MWFIEYLTFPLPKNLKTLFTANQIMKNRVIKFTLIVFSSFLFLWGCEEMFRRKIGGFGGSYPFVEYWDIKATESEILDAIKELKLENPMLHPSHQQDFVPNRNSEYDWDSPEMLEYSKKYELDSLIPLPNKTKTNTKNGYWLFIDFYYFDTGEIVHTWTRPDFDSTVTTFALVSLNDRLINRDYWYLTNKREIRKFKERIVDKIQEKINKRKKSRTI